MTHGVRFVSSWNGFFSFFIQCLQGLTAIFYVFLSLSSKTFTIRHSQDGDNPLNPL